MIYLHDGYFDGLLSCVYAHYYKEKATGIFETNTYEPRLFEETVFIETNKEEARKVYQAILSKLSSQAYFDIFNSFLSCEYYKDWYILKYLVAAFKLGKDITKLHSHEATYEVKRLSKKVGFEAHRFKGLLRFSEVNEYLYAPFEPDNDILILLANHFADRLKKEKFIIHDKKRGKAMLCNYGDYVISEFTLDEEIEFSENEKQFRNLWIGYFNAIGIESRKNLKLQQQFVPKKYRKNITEFNQ